MSGSRSDIGNGLRVGLIGAGRVARTHAEGFDHHGARIAMVADPRIEAAEELASGYGAKAVEHFDEILSDAGIDAVDIMVPHHLHAPIARAALASGKHIFMDKPLATNVEDGAELCALSEQAADRVFMICHNVQFHPVILQGAQLLRGGLLGRPTAADAWSHGWLDLAPWDFRLSRESTGGGAWVDGAPHLVYALEYLLGPIEQLSCSHATGDSRLEAEDVTSAVARFAGGHVATLRVSYADRLPQHEQGWPAAWSMGFDMHGTGGGLRVELLPDPRLVIYRGEGEPEVEQFDTDFGASFRGAIEEFLRAVREGRRPLVSPRESFRTLAQILQAAGR